MIRIMLDHIGRGFLAFQSTFSNWKMIVGQFGLVYFLKRTTATTTRVTGESAYYFSVSHLFKWNNLVQFMADDDVKSYQMVNGKSQMKFPTNDFNGTDLISFVDNSDETILINFPRTMKRRFRSKPQRRRRRLDHICVCSRAFMRTNKIPTLSIDVITCRHYHRTDEMEWCNLMNSGFERSREKKKNEKKTH